MRPGKPSHAASTAHTINEISGAVWPLRGQNKEGTHCPRDMQRRQALKETAAKCFPGYVFRRSAQQLALESVAVVFPRKPA